ncbi:MAG: hypothetical protein U1F16_03205 [Turneriella sp.]
MKKVGALALLISLQIGCRSFSLKNEPGEPEIDITGTWRLETREQSQMLGTDYHLTGTMEVTKKNNQYQVELDMFYNMTNSMARAQMHRMLRGGKVTTSKNEIRVEDIRLTVRGRDYKGPDKPITEWTNQYGPWQENQMFQKRPDLHDMYFSLREDKGLNYILSRHFEPGPDMILRKVDEKTIAEGQAEKAVVKFRGTVFLLLKDQKALTVVGSQVQQRVSAGRTAIVVDANGHVVARGKIKNVEGSFAAVTLGNGIEKVEPRMAVFVY